MRELDTVLDAISSANHVHCSVSVLEAVQQSDWVTVRQHSHRSKHSSSNSDQNIKQVLPTQ